jgi:hypothetical protein
MIDEPFVKWAGRLKRKLDKPRSFEESKIVVFEKMNI